MALSYVIDKIIKDENSTSCNIVLNLSNGRKTKLILTVEDLKGVTSLSEAQQLLTDKISNKLKQIELFELLVEKLKKA